MKHTKCHWLYTLLLMSMLLTGVSGCKPRRPSGILSPDVMEELLVDYHLAQGMAEARSEGRNADELRYMYIRATLKKHHIKEAVFDSSMVYYSAHSEQMAAICERVCAKIDARGSNMGTRETGINAASKYANLTTQGDTANVWTGMRHATLTPDRLHNLLMLNWPADTATRAGDSFIWHCNTQKVSQSNLPDVYVQLIIRFENDTVTSTTSRIYGDRETELFWKPISALDSLRPTQVTTMIYMSSREQTGNARMDKIQAEALLLSDISLIRMHKKAVETPLHIDSATTRQDTLMVDTTSLDNQGSEVPRQRLSPTQLRDAHLHTSNIQVQKERTTSPFAPQHATRPRKVNRRQ